MNSLFQGRPGVNTFYQICENNFQICKSDRKTSPGAPGKYAVLVEFFHIFRAPVRLVWIVHIMYAQPGTVPENNRPAGHKKGGENMKTTRQDDRTPEQITTHTWLVTATDRFLSGWGGAAGGVSRCAWACDTAENAEKVLAWVRSRREMRYVGLTRRPWYPRAAHVHIYVVGANHPALKGGK
jgi:hypothetical protein